MFQCFQTNVAADGRADADAGRRIAGCPRGIALSQSDVPFIEQDIPCRKGACRKGHVFRQELFASICEEVRHRPRIAGIPCPIKDFPFHIVHPFSSQINEKAPPFGRT